MQTSFTPWQKETFLHSEFHWCCSLSRFVIGHVGVSTLTPPSYTASGPLSVIVSSRWKCHFKVMGSQTGRTERWYIELKPSTKLKSHNMNVEMWRVLLVWSSHFLHSLSGRNGWVFLLSGLLLWLYINKLWQLYCMCEGFIFLLSPPAAFPIFILQ